VYPLIITRDEIGSTFYLTSYLNEAFKKALDRRSTDVTVTPLFCMSIDHLEAFAGALSKVPLSDILHARYRQDSKLQMPFLLPNNKALARVPFGSSPTIDEASGELASYARQLFETPS
jgi:hypothetical protein